MSRNYNVDSTRLVYEPSLNGPWPERRSLATGPLTMRFRLWTRRETVTGLGKTLVMSNLEGLEMKNVELCVFCLTVDKLLINQPPPTVMG
jgi:hypothetical protein